MAVEAKANGEPATLLLDTGCPWCAVDSRLVRRLGLKPVPTGYQASGVSHIGASWVFGGELASLQIGNLCLTNLELGVIDLRRWGVGVSGSPFKDMDGILGSDVLAMNSAVIDCRGRRLWLKPSQREKNRTAPQKQRE